MKMTKKETIQQIKDICTGRSGHTHIFITPLYPCFDVKTSISKDRQAKIHFQHCCNEMSLKEATEELEKAIVNVYYEENQ